MPFHDQRRAESPPLRVWLVAIVVMTQACGTAPTAHPSSANAHPSTRATIPSWESRASACVSRFTCTVECSALLDEPYAANLLAGDIAMLCDRPNEALVVYRRAWNSDPTCALASGIAGAQWLAGDQVGALAFAADAAPCRDLDLWLARRARTAAPDFAATAILRRLSVDPDDAEMLAEQVRWFIAQDTATLAGPTCERAESLAHPGLHDACAARASMVDAQHEAEHHLRRAAALEATNARWVNLGRFLVEQARHAEAAEAYRAALRLAPRDYDATVGLGEALTPACWQTARELFARAQTLDPERPEAFFRFGEMTAATPCAVQETRESIAALERFVELADERAEFAAALELVTRRCTRAQQGSGRSRFPPTCEMGLLQRYELFCSGARGLEAMQRAMMEESAERARPALPTPDCSHPALP